MKTIKINPPIQCEFFGSAFQIVSFSTTNYVNNDALAVVVNTDNGDQLRLSCNIPEAAHLLGKGEFFVKNWSENEPLVDALVKHGAIEIVGAGVPTGQVVAPIARIAVRITDKIDMLSEIEKITDDRETTR